ncbi:MAG: chemotaxis protein CheR [Myxococcales bacterium]|nr:chemotaxis protein CheR [Myxococcales bacterium]
MDLGRHIIHRLAVTDEDAAFFYAFIKRHTGIELNEQKKGLLENRLGGLLRSRGLSSVAAYRREVLSNPTPADVQELTDCIATNYTYFYREPAHFQFLLERVLPDITARAEKTGRRELRMWCAAASTGEEPYTLVMTQMEHFQAAYPQWDAGLLATDISRQALSVAQRGVYRTDQLMRLPRHLKSLYTRPVGQGQIEVLPALRKEVTLRRFNLMNPMYPFRGSFDVIFCRNVLIYFDEDSRQHVLQQLGRALRPGGYLFISQAETIEPPKKLFEVISGSVLRRLSC